MSEKSSLYSTKERMLYMSKEFTKEEVIQQKKAAIKAVNNLLEKYINDASQRHLKKACLISYWLSDFSRFIDFEEKFVPTKNIAYKRGNIVKLNFGFNIGSEYGGLHYGVVLDNKNAHNSPVVTVIPLTSNKESKQIHSNSVDLGNEVYRLLKLKFDTVLKAARLRTATAEQDHHANDELNYLEKIGDEIAGMKEGSIALVNQITTVSKMRIYDPRNLRGVLAGVSLSEDSMNKINQKMKELYIFKD